MVTIERNRKVDIIFSSRAVYLVWRLPGEVLSVGAESNWVFNRFWEYVSAPSQYSFVGHLQFKKKNSTFRYNHKANSTLLITEKSL